MLLSFMSRKQLLWILQSFVLHIISTVAAQVSHRNKSSLFFLISNVTLFSVWSHGTNALM